MSFSYLAACEEWAFLVASPLLTLADYLFLKLG